MSENFDNFINDMNYIRTLNHEPSWAYDAHWTMEATREALRDSLLSGLSTEMCKPSEKVNRDVLDLQLSLIGYNLSIFNPFRPLETKDEQE